MTETRYVPKLATPGGSRGLRYIYAADVSPGESNVRRTTINSKDRTVFGRSVTLHGRLPNGRYLVTTHTLDMRKSPRYTSYGAQRHGHYETTRSSAKRIESLASRVRGE